MSAFGKALMCEEWDVVKLLVKQGVEVNSKQAENVLESAAQAYRWDVVKLLVDHGLDYGLDLNSRKAVWAFVMSLMYQQWDVAKFFVQQGVDVTSEEGSFALIHGSEGFAWDFVKFLVEQGVDMESDGALVALEVASKRGALDVVKLLVGQGVDYLDPALACAKGCGNLDIVELLLEQGADLNSDAGVSALAYALQNHRWDAVMYLVEQGVAANAPAEADALEHAVGSYSWDTVKFLLEQNVEVKTPVGMDALEKASQPSCQWDVVSLLLERGLIPTSEVFGRASHAKAWTVLVQIVKTDCRFAKQGLAKLAQAGEWNWFQVLVEEGMASSTDITECMKDVFASRENVITGMTIYKARWQYQCGHGWADVGYEANTLFEHSYMCTDLNNNMVEFNVGERKYIADTSEMGQHNVKSGRARSLRRVHATPDEWSDPLETVGMEELLHAATHKQSTNIPESICGKFQELSVVGVELIRSAPLRHRYETAMRELRSKYGHFHIQPQPYLCREELLVHEVDGYLNEGFYFHGTDAYTAGVISQFGFDERFSSGIYGDGLYFTPHVCKAMQYAKATLDGVYTLVLARVLVGDVYFANKTLNHIRHAPEQAMGIPGLLYNSVVAEPGNMPGAPGDHQHHTEVVIFDGAQACPVYLIRVKVC
jgi:predicted peroxiredoxin